MWGCTIVIALATSLLLLSTTAVCYDKNIVVCDPGNSTKENCRTLDDALEQMNEDNYSITIVRLGNASYDLLHHHEIFNRTNLRIIGKGAIIDCSSSHNAGISFNNTSNVTISNVTFLRCGARHISTSRNFLHSNHDNFTFIHYNVTLYFMLCQDINLVLVNIEKSNGTGLVFFDSTGHIELLSCTFSENFGLECGLHIFGGGVIIEFGDCKPGETNCTHNLSRNVIDANYEFKNCTFHNNTVSSGGINPTHLPRNKSGYFSFGKGGGLAVYFRGCAKRNTISLHHCHFVSNKAYSGGGLYVIFENKTSNSLDITASNFTDNQCYQGDALTGSFANGGGVHVNFLDGHSNAFHISDSNFTHNTAYYGGGMEIFYEAHAQHNKTTDTIEVVGCTFAKNTARIGAAIQIYRKPTIVQGYSAIPKLCNCNFTDNGGTYHYSKGNIGRTRGTLNIAYTQVYLHGNINFTHSIGSALSLYSSAVDFQAESVVTFTHCTGIDGGAIYLTGAASIIYLHRNLSLKFLRNSALSHGGAIYADQSQEHYTGYSYNCFIRYPNHTISPLHNDYHAEVVFEDNHANDNHSHAIFAQSVLPCVWPRSITSKLADDIELTFCNWINWKFKGHNRSCRDQISTAPASIFFDRSWNQSNKTVNCSNHQIKLHPGRPQSLGIIVRDDLNHTISSETVFTALAAKHTRPKYPEYISNGKITLCDKPDTNVTITLETLTTRAVYTEFQASMLRCPPGLVLSTDNDSSYCICGKGFDSKVFCSEHDFRSAILLGYCMTSSKVPNHRRQELVGRCPFTLAGNDGKPFILLNYTTPEDLNKNFCARYNRKGLLCGQCIEDKGISLFSNTFECVECNSATNRAINWVLYFVLTLGPITILFAIVILLHVSITSGPANAFIFFSQMLTIPLKVLIIQGGWLLYLKGDESTARLMTNLLMYPVYMWSLDFSQMYHFRLCVSTSMKIIDVLILRYVSALYPLILVVIAFVLVELHARNNRIVVLLAKPMCTLCAKVRRKWEGKTSIIDAFATFIIISYIKFIRISITILTPSDVYDDAGHAVAYTVNYDNQVMYFSKEHAPYVLLALFVMCTFGILTPLLLTVYPTTWFQCFLNRCNFSTQGLRTFVEAFHGCYKDGTNGTPDRRFFAGLYFAFRIVIFTIYMMSTSYYAMFLLLQIAYSIFLFLTAVLQPYKKTLYNCIDAFFFGLSITIASLVSYLYVNLPTSRKLPHKVFILTYVLNFVPLLYMIAYMVYWFSWKSQWLRSKFKSLWERKEAKRNEDEIAERELTVSVTDVSTDPDRVANPRGYESDSSYEDDHMIPQFASEQAPLTRASQRRYGTVIITAATY